MCIEDVHSKKKLDMPLWAGAWTLNKTHTVFKDRFLAV
jgi:hypothetical protein